VYKIDRLTGVLADFANIVEILDTRGASFVPVTQQLSTMISMGRLTLNVLLSLRWRRQPDDAEPRRQKRHALPLLCFPPADRQAAPRRSRARAEGSHHNGCNSGGFASREWPASALCSRWLTTQRMGEGAPKRPFTTPPTLRDCIHMADRVDAGGRVLSRLRSAENAHDQLDQLIEPERFADKARVSLDVGAHAPLRYGAHDDAGDVAVRLGFAHCAEQPWTIKHRHHEVGDARRQMVLWGAMPRSADLGFVLATAETPLLGRGTWFDMCPGRGGRWALRTGFAYAEIGGGVAADRSDQAQQPLGKIRCSGFRDVS
jgi:hypothetical protein